MIHSIVLNYLTILNYPNIPFYIIILIYSSISVILIYPIIILKSIYLITFNYLSTLTNLIYVIHSIDLNYVFILPKFLNHQIKFSNLNQLPHLPSTNNVIQKLNPTILIHFLIFNHLIPSIPLIVFIIVLFLLILNFLILLNLLNVVYLLISYHPLVIIIQLILIPLLNQILKFFFNSLNYPNRLNYYYNNCFILLYNMYYTNFKKWKIM